MLNFQSKMTRFDWNCSIFSLKWPNFDWKCSILIENAQFLVQNDLILIEIGLYQLKFKVTFGLLQMWTCLCLNTPMSQPALFFSDSTRDNVKLFTSSHTEPLINLQVHFPSGSSHINKCYAIRNQIHKIYHIKYISLYAEFPRAQN